MVWTIGSSSVLQGWRNIFKKLSYGLECLFELSSVSCQFIHTFYTHSPKTLHSFLASVWDREAHSAPYSKKMISYDGYLAWCWRRSFSRAKKKKGICLCLTGNYYPSCSCVYHLITPPHSCLQLLQLVCITFIPSFLFVSTLKDDRYRKPKFICLWSHTALAGSEK